MRYHNITKDDMKNGDGLRVVLWVAGCSHKCYGCHNTVTWDEFGGLEFDKNAKKELFAELEKDYVSGITFSGGDPLYYANRSAIEALAKEIKEVFQEKTIWLYTGYCWEEIKQLPIWNYIDVCVDGKFVKELSDHKLHWKGSSNQRVIHVSETMKQNKIVLWDK